ncbi:HNH endonuclease [Streptomyces sp. BI20]|uniref:HNH endonuclease n=1 Tax=Streptomyces sp. BI20 TaxID=3403460 RepID=UPI003C73E015
MPTITVSTPADPESALVRALLGELTSMRCHRRSPHKPLAVLWALGRGADGHWEPATWPEFEQAVGGLLRRFGGGAGATPHYPFVHLSTSAFWHVAEGADRFPSGAAVSPQRLLDAGARAGFTPEAARLLADPLTRLRAVTAVRQTYLPHLDQTRLLAAVHLDGLLPPSVRRPTEQDVATRFASLTDTDHDADPEEAAAALPAPRVPRGGTQAPRDERLARRVKELHRHLCQLCETKLGLPGERIAQAAHAQALGRPHHGPDRLSNLLCLCPDHHALYDNLVLYVAEDGAVWSIRDRADRSRDTLLRPEGLRQATGHTVDPAHLAYQRELCGRA